MTDFMKASFILDYLKKVSHEAAWLKEEDILSKASHEELNFYYRWCCLPC